jgi:hypothetical protein
MNMLWLQLRSAAGGLDEVEMARLILQILNAAAESEEVFRPLLARIQRDEARCLAAAHSFDTPLMAKIIGGHCRAMFKLRHEGWPTGECDELIAAMKRASEALDTSALVDAFERLLQLCQSESRASIRQARLREIDRAREQAVVALGGARWEEVGRAFADMLGSLSEVRPDFEELPSLIAEAKASGVFEQRADGGVALAENVFSILRALVNRYANKLDRESFERMMSALMRDRAVIPPDELLLLMSDVVGRAVAFREGDQKLPLPARRPQFRRN